MPAKPYTATVFDDSGSHKGIDAKDSKQLMPGAREVYATGKNELKRDENKTKPAPKLGVKGFPS
jgi:hypothetical protein